MKRIEIAYCKYEICIFRENVSAQDLLSGWLGWMGWDVCFVSFFIYIVLPGFQHKNYRQVLDLFNKRTKLLEGGEGQIEMCYCKASQERVLFSCSLPWDQSALRFYFIFLKKLLKRSRNSLKNQTLSPPLFKSVTLAASRGFTVTRGFAFRLWDYAIIYSFILKDFCLYLLIYLWCTVCMISS